MKQGTKKEISKRDELILDAIVNDYITSSGPVGSRTISKKYGLNLSPATIRNVASDLEERGYLVQPHTSSGRVPTDKGFRFYVDKLLHLKQLTKSQRNRIELNYDLNELSIKEILEETSKVLSQISHNVGLVLKPRLSMSVFEHIEFVKLSKDKVLVVFITKTGAVYNKKVKVSDPFAQSDLHRMSNYLSDIMCGLTLYEVRSKIVEEMDNERVRCDRLYSKALGAFKDITEEEEEENDIYIEGMSNIINAPIFKDLKEIKNILRAFEDKQLLINILDKSISKDGIVTFIGAENKLDELKNFSIVSSHYGRDGNTLGTLGVIGPRHMDYARVIPLVDYMSKLVSRLIEVIK